MAEADELARYAEDARADARRDVELDEVDLIQVSYWRAYIKRLDQLEAMKARRARV